MDEERYTAELDRLAHLLQEDIDDNLIQYAELSMSYPYPRRIK